MQWREYELRRLQQEGLNVNEEATPPALPSPAKGPAEEQQHACNPRQQQEAEETDEDKALQVSGMLR